MINSAVYFVSTSSISVSWQWYNENQGIIKWTFQNKSSQVQSFILLRGAETVDLTTQQSTIVDYYYFGDAFYPIYLQAGLTHFAKDLITLTNSGNLESNVPPLGVIKFGDKYLVAFVFTLAPGSTYEMLEGGYVTEGNYRILPYNPIAVPVKPIQVLPVCVAYNPEAVIIYDDQTNEIVEGYQPNPKTFSAMVYQCDGQYIQLFPAPIYLGQCQQNPLNGIMREALSWIDQMLKDALQDFEKSINKL